MMILLALGNCWGAVLQTYISSQLILAKTNVLQPMHSRVPYLELLIDILNIHRRVHSLNCVNDLLLGEQICVCTSALHENLRQPCSMQSRIINYESTVLTYRLDHTMTYSVNLLGTGQPYGVQSKSIGVANCGNCSSGGDSTHREFNFREFSNRSVKRMKWVNSAPTFGIGQASQIQPDWTLQGNDWTGGKTKGHSNYSPFKKDICLWCCLVGHRHPPNHLENQINSSRDKFKSNDPIRGEL